MTTDCDRLARLFNFADDDARATPALIAEARAHVEACERCAREFGADVATAERLALIPPLPPPRLRARRRGPLVVAIATVIAATLALIVVTQHRTVAPAVPATATLQFELPPGTRFTQTSGVIRFDRTGPSTVYETQVYRPLTQNRP